MRYLSLFSGVEAATLAWKPMGWKPIAFAEFDAFPSVVLAHHYPDVPNLGDVTKIEGSRYCGTVDLIVGGSPCQGFSVAGERLGLDDPRSALALAYVRLLSEVRPRWFVWENVPGVLSTNDGEDFRAFIEKITEIGYGVSWRILDAQYVRVPGFERAIPQKRRRIFVVGYLGDWLKPAKVLFESKSLSGSFESGTEKGQTIAYFHQRSSDKSNAMRPHIFKLRSGCEGGGKGYLGQDGMSFTLSCNNDQYLMTPQGLVRKLTPLECERLMGFPDEYTKVPYRGKSADDCPDSLRYKACGNSMCVNVMRWIGLRIQEVDSSIQSKSSQPLKSDSKKGDEPHGLDIH